MSKLELAVGCQLCIRWHSQVLLVLHTDFLKHLQKNSVVHGKILEVQVHGDAWRHIEEDKGEEVSVRHDEAEHQRIVL